MKKELWTTKEVKFLRNNWSVMTGADIAEHLGRKKSAVYSKAVSLGIRKNIKHKKASTPRSLSVKSKAPKGVQQTLNLSNVKTVKEFNRTPWSPEEDKFLMDSYKLLTYSEIGRRLGRTSIAISNRMRKKGLIKDANKSFKKLPKINLETAQKSVAKELTKVAKNKTPVAVVKKQPKISVQNIITLTSVAANVGLAAVIFYLLFIY